MVQRPGDGVPEAVLAHGHGISRKTIYQYLCGGRTNIFLSIIHRYESGCGACRLD